MNLGKMKLAMKMKTMMATPMVMRGMTPTFTIDVFNSTEASE